jgi:adenosylcobinamide-GDP ribazoletransferase
MKSAIHDLKVAIAFLTRIPVSHGPVLSMGGVSSWFPIVGAVVGLIASGVWVVGNTVLAPLSASALTIAVIVLITGAFHHDGLADSMDGLVGGWNPEQRREILKDSRHGTYGVMALVLQVAIQVSLLSELSVASGVVALVICQSVGRAAAVWIMKSGAGISEGLGANYVSDVKVGNIVFATLTCFLLMGSLMGPMFVIVAAVVYLVSRFFAQWAIKKIGGIVGDVLGATEQVGESVALLTIVVLVHQGVTIPWW